MRRRRNLLRQESGQGTTEYILILAVVVSIIIGLLYNFNRSFKSYTDHFFDTYIACLLELGELPGAPNTICEFPEFPPPDLADGSGGRSRGESGNESSDSSNSEDSSSNDENSQSATDREGNGEVTGGGGGGRGGSTVSARALGRQRRTSSTPLGAVKGEKEESVFGNDALLGGGSAAVVGRIEGSSRRSATRLDYDVFGEGGEQDVEEKRKPVVTGQTQGSDALKPKKAVENMNRKPAAKDDEPKGGFSFGGMIRLIFIVGIIIAIVVFFGGQIMQIAKSREKGG